MDSSDQADPLGGPIIREADWLGPPNETSDVRHGHGPIKAPATASGRHPDRDRRDTQKTRLKSNGWFEQSHERGGLFSTP
jgi:hypothetical protein